jgi:hypothetical protein
VFQPEALKETNFAVKMTRPTTHIKSTRQGSILDSIAS